MTVVAIELGLEREVITKVTIFTNERFLIDNRDVSMVLLTPCTLKFNTARFKVGGPSLTP